MSRSSNLKSDLMTRNGLLLHRTLETYRAYIWEVKIHTPSLGCTISSHLVSLASGCNLLGLGGDELQPMPQKFGDMGHQQMTKSYIG